MKVWFSLNIHTEDHNIPSNLKFLVEEVVPKIHDDYGVKPTLFIQSEPPQCGESSLFRVFPDLVLKLAKYGEIGLHSHCIHNLEPLHQVMHIKNAVSEATRFKPISWCCGDWLVNKHTLEALSIFGLKIDSSITPPRHTWFNPQLPYNPSKNNIHKIGNPHFNILEVPNAPRLRLSTEIGAMKTRSWTTAWLMRLNQFVDEVPLVFPCHSYDLLNQPRYWHLLGFINWLTKTYNVKMVTIRDFLNYKPNIKIHHQLRVYKWELKRFIRNQWIRDK